MLNFIYGRTGTGKSAELFSRASAAAVGGKRVFILVPDRDAVAAERRASTLRGAGNIDVVTFRRLSNYVFRALGGICEKYVGAGAKKVIMYSVLDTLKPRLADYKNISKTDLNMTEKLVKARGEMMRNDIAPEALADAATRLDGKTASKLSDLALIFSEFDRAVATRWKDPDGMLSAVSSLDGTSDFFRGSEVYIDSFSAFTSQQYGLLERIFAGADNVCVTVAYEPDGDKNEPAFMTLENTASMLKKTAVRAGIKLGENTILRVPTRYENDELSFLSSNLWSSSRAVKAHYAGEAKNIRVVGASNAYAEAEAVAVDICKKIHGGSRLYDIAVITRSTDEYKGVIDAVFDKYGIPYFISEKTDISEMSLIKFVTSAISVARHGFFSDDVISYIKTDLCGVEAEDLFAFENYIIKWGISGKKFTDGDFLMNPRGYEDTFTENDAVMLDKINSTRRAVIEPLMRFVGVMKSQKTVREYATALFDYLSLLAVPERLSEFAERAHERGDLALESTQRKLWRAFCDALDSLVTSVGDTECDLDGFSVYLSAMLSETDIGRIPTAIDRVLIADAVLTSVPSVKHVYVIGCYAGGFPHRVGEDGIFTEREKSELEAVGVEISSRLWKKLSDELFFFYTAVAAPSKTLTVTHPRCDADGDAIEKSEGVLRILELFPSLKDENFEETPRLDLIWSESAAIEHVLGGGALGKALSEYYAAVPEYAERLKYLSVPMSAKDCALEKKTADELFKGTINISPTRLEKYVRCRFAYFCEYELKLSDESARRFSEKDIGTVMHKIMEIAVRFAAENPAVPDEELDKKVREAAEYELGVLTSGAAPKRTLHLIDSLCAAAHEYLKYIRAEMKQSKFKPISYELYIGNGGVEPLKLDDGRVRVNIHGRIDRVDAYEAGDGTLRVLVTDYKTGKKVFDLKNVALGLDLQMLLYLFSVWENGEKYYGKEIAPAGVQYYGIAVPSLSLSLDETPSVKAKKSGVFLSDIEVLTALDENLSGEYIPVKIKDIENYSDDGEIKKLASDKKLEELKENVKAIVLKTANEMKDGKANAEPLEISQNDSPCEYCDYRAVCRRAKVTFQTEEDTEENEE